MPKSKAFYEDLREKIKVKEKENNFWSYNDKYKYNPPFKNTFANFRPSKNSNNFY